MGAVKADPGTRLYSWHPHPRRCTSPSLQQTQHRHFPATDRVTVAQEVAEGNLGQPARKCSHARQRERTEDSATGVARNVRTLTRTLGRRSVGTSLRETAYPALASILRTARTGPLARRNRRRTGPSRARMSTKHALKTLILTACPSGELQGANWPASDPSPAKARFRMTGLGWGASTQCPRHPKPSECLT